MTNERTLVAGEYLFREGESAEYGYVVKGGVIEIVKVSQEGEMILSKMGPGNIFGELAIIDGSPRSAGARAVEDSVVTEIRSDTFLEYIREKPNAALRIMQNLSDEIRISNRKLSSRSPHDKNQLENDDLVIFSDPSTDEEINDTDAIYDQPPSTLIVYSSILILSLFLAAFLFSYFSEIDTVVSARGKFTTRTPNVVIQASANSVIKTLLVERGQVVQEGQLIALLDDTIANTSFEMSFEELQIVKARLNRHNIETELLDTRDSLPHDAGLDSSNQDILVKRMRHYQAKWRSFSSKVNKLNQELKSAMENLLILEKQKEIKIKIENMKRNLFEKNIGSHLQYMEAQEATLDAERRVLDGKNNLKKFETELISIQAEEKAFLAQWAASLAEEISKDEEAYMKLSQNQILLRQEVENVEVRSPMAGIILDLPKVAVGSIVRKGDEILTLVQNDQLLFLEVDIDPRDINDTKIGMPVSVKLDALPFQEFGDLKGKLVFLSQDTFSESLSGEEGEFYRGRIEIPTGEAQNLPTSFKLTQGMLANADVKVGKRKLITYFTYPITGAFGDAFREPD